MRFLVWVVAMILSFGALAADDPFAFTPPPDKGMIETPFGPAPAIRDWRKDTPQALVDGVAAYEEEDYETAKRWFLPLAKKGNAVAKNYIGRMHDDKSGFDSNNNTACDWYEKSATNGYASGQFNIGSCYISGEGRKKSLPNSIRWFYPLGVTGDKIVQNKIAYALKDIDQTALAFEWFKKAAMNGSKFAEFALYVHGREEMVPDFTAFDWVCVMFGIYSGQETDYCD